MQRFGLIFWKVPPRWKSYHSTCFSILRDLLSKGPNYSFSNFKVFLSSSKWGILPEIDDKLQLFPNCCPIDIQPTWCWRQLFQNLLLLQLQTINQRDVTLWLFHTKFPKQKVLLCISGSGAGGLSNFSGL